MIRHPAVSGSFYPSSSSQLRQILADMIPVVEENKKQEAIAVIAPHAGYIYSGKVAGETWAGVKIPETVVIMGPSHHGRGQPLALGVSDWDMVLGRVEVERRLVDIILDISTIITEDDTAHVPEHSIEVQVPFIQMLQENLKILPILVSRISYDICVQAGHDLAAAIRRFDQPVLLAASTDMTHYEARHNALIKDKQAIEKIMSLDPFGLYQVVVEQQISMCGVMPTVIIMLAAMELGAERAELVRYTDSGEVSGDIDQVVGYAGIIMV